MYINTKYLNFVYENEVVVQEKTKPDGKDDVGVVLKKQDLGYLYLKTGHIVANDPLVLSETDPFTVVVTPGNYLVYIHVAHFDSPVSGLNKRVAFATLKFSDNKAVKWEMALVENQDTGELGDNQFFGYAVDSGTGGFMDKSVADELTAKLNAIGMDNYDEIFAKIDKQMDEAYTRLHSYGYAIDNMTGGTEHDFAAFSSGDGDGLYPSYFGYDENGKPCILVTDFCFLGADERQ